MCLSVCVCVCVYCLCVCGCEFTFFVYVCGWGILVIFHANMMFVLCIKV